MTVAGSTVLAWRRLVPPGHDAARLQALGTGWRLDGCAVFVDTAGPCLVTYMVDCDAAWRSTAVRVAGWAGTQPIANRSPRRHRAPVDAERPGRPGSGRLRGRGSPASRRRRTCCRSVACA